jgi:hypothetical protein
VTVDLYFKDGQLDKAKLVLDAHLPSREFLVGYGGKRKKVLLKAGDEYTFSYAKNSIKKSGMKERGLC